MSKFALTYTGPRKAARAKIVEVLVAFPKAMFVEKDDGLFEVTAESGFAQQVASHGDWRATEIGA
ncbi:MAG: hypothetical protein ABSF50_05245 [Burkholderiaceae bacterium]|jgi:hypothetical protein